MKKVIYSLALVTLLSTSAVFADDTVAPPTPAEAANPSEAPKVDVKAAVKLSHREAKKACLQENPKLKGKDLKKCVHEKSGK